MTPPALSLPTTAMKPWSARSRRIPAQSTQNASPVGSAIRGGAPEIAWVSYA